MSIDLSKLSPAPWHVEHFAYGYGLTHGPTDDASERFSVDDPLSIPDMEFIALARNAFDVMLRRGWNSVIDLDKWAVGPAFALPEQLLDRRWPDPFIALVEADRWYRDNVENKQEVSPNADQPT